MITAATIVAPAPGVSADVDHRTLELGPRHFELSPTGLLVWQLLDGATPLGELASDIAEAFDQPVRSIQGDLERLVALLQRLQFVEIVDRGHQPAGPRSSNARPRTDAFLRALASWAIDDTVEVVVPDAPIDTVLSAVRQAKLTGILGVAYAAGAADLPDELVDLVEVLELEHFHLAQRFQQYEAVLARVLDALDRGGVEVRVLKGMAHARLDYRSWQMRSMNDIDLLVPRARLDDIEGLLSAVGTRRHSPELRAGFDGRFGKAVTLVVDPYVEIDVHAQLVSGPYGTWMRTDELFAAGRPLPVGGSDGVALSLEDAFVHACYTAVVADWHVNLRALLDVTVLAAQAPSPELVSARCRSWRAGPVVRAATAAAASELPHFADALARATAAVEIEERPFDRLVARCEILPGRNYVVREALATAAQPTAAAKVGYARALLFPDRGVKDPFATRLRRGWRARRA